MLLCLCWASHKTIQTELVGLVPISSTENAQQTSLINLKPSETNNVMGYDPIWPDSQLE
jgi:hypothetical protein